MKFMPRRKLLVMGLILLILSACNSGSAADTPLQELPDTIELFFIYEESDEAYDIKADFHALLQDIDIAHPYSVYTLNIASQNGAERFNALAYDLLGLNTTSRLHLPVLILHGQAYQGMDDISVNLYEAVLTAAHDLFTRGYVYNPRFRRTGAELFANYNIQPDNITLVYFYRIVCPACEEVAHHFENMPAAVNGRQIDLITFNTRSGNNRERFLAFLDSYNVPNQYRRVPIVFTTDGFYSGPESIEELFNSGLENISGPGLEFP